jgi:DedD protein
MDDALRQRLVGAAVIIALVVIFVPMLLDSPEEAVRTEQVDLTIPPRTEPGVETRRLPLDPNMTAPTPVPDAHEEPATTAVAEPPDEAPAPIVRAPPPAPRTEPTPPPPPSPALPKPDVVATAPLPAVPAPVKGGRFVAQFGSYAERANADTLIRDLAKAGIPADLETLAGNGGRSLYRVRSRAYASRAEADSARLSAQRQIAGLASTVIELSVGNPAQSQPVTSNLSGWAVQVGVFTKAEGAEELAGRLRAAGFAAFVEPVKLAGGQTSHRVRVGPEVKRENAARIQADLKSRFKLDALVVAHP